MRPVPNAAHGQGRRARPGLTPSRPGSRRGGSAGRGLLCCGPPGARSPPEPPGPTDATSRHSFREERTEEGGGIRTSAWFFGRIIRVQRVASAFRPPGGPEEASGRMPGYSRHPRRVALDVSHRLVAAREWRKEVTMVTGDTKQAICSPLSQVHNTHLM